MKREYTKRSQSNNNDAFMIIYVGCENDSKQQKTILDISNRQENTAEAVLILTLLLVSSKVKPSMPHRVTNIEMPPNIETNVFSLALWHQLNKP